MLDKNVVSEKQFYAKNRKMLRRWFEKFHTKSKGIWLVYDKGENRTLTYNEIVEEALCFGWIDSLPRSLSDTQAMFYLSPRKAKSPWSRLNKQRVEKLIKYRKMTQAGLDIIQRSKNDGSWTIYDSIEELIVPSDLKSALNKNKIAMKNFEEFSSSSKKQILWYVVSAKHQETREKRIIQIVNGAEKGLNPLEYRKKVS